MRVCAAAADVIAGRYRLEERLGYGGMGSVWRATHLVTGKSVALKLLREGADAVQRARFLLEARAVCKIAHPHVVAIHDVLDVDGRAPAIVMDLLDGESLRQRLDREERLPEAEVIRIATDILGALVTVHERGVVHRDLKPENVFLALRHAAADSAYDVKLLDFGIAKVTAFTAEDADTGLTRTEVMVGTPQYMAPEQVYGEKDLDGRSDLWALGILMYECLRGTRPTDGANLGQVFKTITVGPLDPITTKMPEVDPNLARCIAWCLERQRDARPANASELLLALRGRSEAARRGRSWRLAALLAVAAVSVGGGLALRGRTTTVREVDAPATIAAAADTTPAVVAPTARLDEEPPRVDAGARAVAPVRRAAKSSSSPRGAGSVILAPPF